MNFRARSIFCLALLAYLSAACDAPRDRRAAYNERSSTFNSIPTFSGFSVQQPGPTGTASPPPSTGSGSGSPENPGSSQIPSEASHCVWSADGIAGFQSNHSTIGSYNFCKSSTTESNVFIQVKTPITDSYLCVVPTTHNGTKSTYVGEPRCIMANDPKKIFKITLFKNRAGYSSYPITGAMIMKDKHEWFPSPYYQYMLIPDAYLFCVEYLAQTNNGSYCEAFNMVGKFVYYQF